MRNALTPIIGIAILALLIALVYFASGRSDRELDRSVMGTEGLSIWLRRNEIEVIHSHPSANPLVGEISLGIAPLYDTDFYDSRQPDETDAERMASTSPRQIDADMLGDMRSKIPMLIVMPKWRYGFAMTGIAHQQTQIPPKEVKAVMAQFDLQPLGLLPIANEITEGTLVGNLGDTPLQSAVFRAQLFDRATLPKGCVERLGIAQGAYLVECPPSDRSKISYWLSDPDLLSNHGLNIADHAAAAPLWIAPLRGAHQGPILLAQHPVWLRETDEAHEPYERTPEDLLRLFKWPLSAFWAMGAAVLALAFWRGAKRYGAPKGRVIDKAASSRRAAIAAKARLLRLSGADARMAAEHVRARMSDMAGHALGQTAANEAGVHRWLSLIERRDAQLAADLRQTVAAITPDLPHGELLRLIEKFHDLSRKASDAA